MSTRGYTSCIQQFISDKRVVFMVPMKVRLKFSSAFKLFAKETITLITDPSGD